MLLATIAMPRAQHGSFASAANHQRATDQRETTNEQRPSVLLITLDTVRADRMGFLGSTRGLTPELDALARESTVFTRAYSQAPITTVSHATMLTGAYPPLHRVNDFGAPLRAAVPYLPDLLKRAGYRTAAFVGSLILDPREGTAPGFDRGFDRYEAGFHRRQRGDDRYQSVERRGDEVAARAISWIRDAGAGPWFVWAHLYDAHHPYDPPGDLKRRFASAPYDGEIAAADRAAGAMIHSIGPDTIVIVAADHGEALGEHGEDTHGIFLYDETLHVPLVLRLPGRATAGTRVAARVRLVDVAPTILEAVGVPVPPEMQGESLLPLVGAVRLAPKASDRPVYAETDYPRQAFGWAPLVSWRADRFLFVRAPRRELYDLVADPHATRNILTSRPRVADGIDGELRAFIERTTRAAGSRSDARVDPALAERLAALGYIGGSAGSAPASGVDPKDRMRTANALQRAIATVEDGKFAAAIPLLEQVTAREPTIYIAQLNLGIARAREHRPAQAIAPLKQAVALQPDAMIAHYELAIALYDTGKLQDAAEHLLIVASRMPQWADARYSLGSVYARIDRVEDAKTELRAALALEPRHFRANLLLGRIVTLQGRAAEAIPYLETAVSVQPHSAEARQFLAEAQGKARAR